MITLRIVDVDTQAEVSRAELGDDDQLTYTGADVAQGLIAQTARTRNVTPAEAIAELADTGWSNGYLMVARELQPARTAPVAAGVSRKRLRG